MINSLYNEEWLNGDYYPQVVAYYYKEWKNWAMHELHTHNQMEIMYVINGGCIVETPKMQHIMKKCDFILLDANEPHRLIVQNGTSCRMLNIEFGFKKKDGEFPSLRQICGEVSTLNTFIGLRQNYIVCKDPDEIYHTLKNLVIELDEGSADKEFMIQLLLSELLIKISRLAVIKKGNETETSGVYVKKALNYIYQHYDCDIKVKDIASVINIHPGYLHRIFKENTGSTIIEYLTKLRIDKAKMLLSNTDIPVIDISNYVGINSRQYFTYVFKKHSGMSPIEFRKSISKAKWNKCENKC